jgi:large subunit ribosomal protein L30
MSAATKKKTKSKSLHKAPAKPRVARKHVAPSKKPEVHPAPTPSPVKKEPVPEKNYLLAIRLKGSFGTPWPIERALETLRLKRKFNAVLLDDTPATIGMLRKAKDYVTWGKAKKTDIVVLLRERGEFLEGASVTDETIRQKYGESSVQELASALTEGRINLPTLWQKGLKPVFRLHPPSGGFEGSIKRAHGSRGELGKRDSALSGLLAHMA